MLVKKVKLLFTSITAIEDYLYCPRLYYWKRIRKIEKRILNIPFMLGRIIHPTVKLLYESPKKAPTSAVSLLKIEKKEALKHLPVNKEQQEELNELEYIILGMLQAYNKRYRQFIKKAYVLESEKPFHYKGIPGVVLVGRLDNLFQVAKKVILHELKHTKYLTPDYVDAVKTKMQPAIYFYFGGVGINEIMYDVIKKPSIRQKQNETYRDFLVRLSEWYEDKPEEKFYVERTDVPFIKKDALLNTLIRVTNDLKRNGTEKLPYYQDFTRCVADRGRRCEMYDICHGENEEEALVSYDRKKDYKVNMKE